jgi:uracil phosphoribosyltransferase
VLSLLIALCAVSAFHQISRGISKGNLLIQRDETTKKPRLFICQLPNDLQNKKLLLLDPMLATGGSAKLAIQLLIDKGVPQEHVCVPPLLLSVLLQIPLAWMPLFLRILCCCSCHW